MYRKTYYSVSGYSRFRVHLREFTIVIMLNQAHPNVLRFAGRLSQGNRQRSSCGLPGHTELWLWFAKCATPDAAIRSSG